MGCPGQWSRMEQTLHSLCFSCVQMDFPCFSLCCALTPPRAPEPPLSAFPHSRDVPVHHLHDLIGLLQSLPCLSLTEEPKTGPSNSGVASPALRRGEESPSSAFWRRSSQCSPGYHSPSFPPGHFPGSCSISEEVKQDLLLTHRVHPALLEPFPCSSRIPETSDFSWKTMMEMKNGTGQHALDSGSFHFVQTGCRHSLEKSQDSKRWC